MDQPIIICRRVLRQPAAGLLVFAWARAGSARQNNKTITAITVTNSIRVKARFDLSGKQFVLIRQEESHSLAFEYRIVAQETGSVLVCANLGRWWCPAG